METRVKNLIEPKEDSAASSLTDGSVGNRPPKSTKSKRHVAWNTVRRFFRTGNPFKTEREKQQQASVPDQRSLSARIQNTDKPAAQQIQVIQAGDERRPETEEHLVAAQAGDERRPETEGHLAAAQAGDERRAEIEHLAIDLTSPPISDSRSPISSYFALQALDSFVNNKYAVIGALCMFVIATGVLIALTYGAAACPLLASWLAPLAAGELLGITIATGVVAGLSALPLARSAYSSIKSTFFALNPSSDNIRNNVVGSDFGI